MHKNIYAIVGELLDTPTRLSEVKVFDYNTLNIKWVTWEQIVKKMDAGGNVINANNILNNNYNIPTYRAIKGKRRFTGQNKPSEGIALAVVTQSPNSRIVMGLLVHRAPNRLQLVKLGCHADWIKNITNIKVEPQSNIGADIINEWTLSYKDILPQIPINEIASKGKGKGKVEVEVATTHKPNWE